MRPHAPAQGDAEPRLRSRTSTPHRHAHLRYQELTAVHARPVGSVRTCRLGRGLRPLRRGVPRVASAPDPTKVFMPSTHARQTAALQGTYEARTAPKREPRRTPGDSSIIEIPICNFAMSLTSQGVWW